MTIDFNIRVLSSTYPRITSRWIPLQEKRRVFQAHFRLLGNAPEQFASRLKLRFGCAQGKPLREFSLFCDCIRLKDKRTESPVLLFVFE